MKSMIDMVNIKYSEDTSAIKMAVTRKKKKYNSTEKKAYLARLGNRMNWKWEVSEIGWLVLNG
jgi:hypothetical protein